MAAPATAAQPTEQLDMGALPSASRHPHPEGPNPTSLSQRTLCRYPSEVGTVCVNRASTGLCGGQRATAVPTATTQDSRRTLEIGPRRLRANRGSLPAANPPSRGSQPKLVGLPGESSRGDRCFRLLHRTIGDVQTVALFLRHRAWPPEDPALQCDATPDSRVGGAAVA